MTYSEINAEIKAAPKTWLPGLLVAVVKATLDKKVLKPGGAARIAQEVEDEATGQPEDVASGSSSATGWVRCEVLFPHVREINGETYMLEPMLSGVVALPDDEDTRKTIKAGWLKVHAPNADISRPASK